jgi:hypothetical protein
MRRVASSSFALSQVRQPRSSKTQDYPDVLLVALTRAVRRERRDPLMKRQYFFERECVHRDGGADGEIYNGMFYVQALQRLQSDEALKMAGKVSPFFWVDAPRVLVWLCRQCATELSIADAPRAIAQGARR